MIPYSQRQDAQKIPSYISNSVSHSKRHARAVSHTHKPAAVMTLGEQADDLIKGNPLPVDF